MKKQILFVDDDQNLLQGIKRALRGMEKEWATDYLSNAGEIAGILKRSGPAVIVTDWNMPGVSGVELCQQVRELEKKKEIGFCYLILLTGRQGVEGAVEALEKGADDFITKPFDARELVARIRSGFRIIELENSLRAALQQMESLAFTDPLTGLLNRRRGMEILETELARVRRVKQPLSAIMADVDHFKKVNDSYGHAAGDTVLREIAGRFQKMARKYDSVIRWGGEEILVVCPETSAHDISGVAERFRLAVCSEDIEVCPQTKLNVTASLGAATVCADGLTGAGLLIGQADQALYQAKNSGRNCARSFS